VKPVAPPAGSASAPQALRARSAVIASSPRVPFATPSVRGSINLKGARIDDLVMLRHRATVDRRSAPVPLLSPQGARAASFIGFGWNGDGVNVPGPDTVWQASSNVLTPGRPVTLSWTNPAGVRFEIAIAVDDQYLFTTTQRVTNGAEAPIVLRPYAYSSRAGRSADISSWTVHVGPMRVANGEADYGIDWATVREAGPGGLNFDRSTGWIGFTDKYWLTALAPAGPAVTAFRHSAAGSYQADVAGDERIVAPGRTLQFQTRVFAGAKEKAALDRYEAAGIDKLSKSIDFGWFEWFMRPIFDLLNWLFKVTGNFGVAIICLTFIVRLLMFPIADKQFKSMAGMRRLQPKMKALQEKYKDDKPRLQQELLKLYQQEKINPAAGCLPILLQIPIFYALYKVLLVAVEMRHQPFALWIKDLSAPDPLTPLNLFGLLNFDPPAIIAIGILPILLGVTMWLQFKLNPAPMDPVQQQVFSIMPWVLMFVMAPFAAGLQLYWVVSNILTIAQQWWLYKRYDLHYADTHPIKT
ncbi:MAG TPA: membrane protein insertase YidC, partial [Sphingomicrobium sp.]|nr:membrane protein insertase YidC [Sphingomicrobium sp.]